MFDALGAEQRPSSDLCGQRVRFVWHCAFSSSRPARLRPNGNWSAKFFRVVISARCRWHRFDICWPSRKEVFLDRICSETDEMKTEAICSLAGILESESMLVLWDASFAERLWCVFEIAAFLNSQQTRERPLVVCPTLTGPITISVYSMATMAFIPLLVLPSKMPSEIKFAVHIAALTTAGGVVAYSCCHVLRGFYRSVEVMQRRLLCLRVAELKCSCCSAGQCIPTGGEKSCDREILSGIIAIWFGSTQNFADYVGTEVVDAITSQIEQDAFSYAGSVAIVSPAQWAMFDLMQFEVRRDHPLWASFTVWLAMGLTIFLLCPIFFSWAKFCAYHLRHESSSRCGEVFKSLLMMVYVSPVVVFGLGAIGVGWFFPVWNFRSIVIVAILLPGWAFMCLLRRCGNGYLGRFLVQQRLVRTGVPCQG
ncbi:unnamed protein product [Effrenium voratum]|nr:unnamed protein product [Effrenium voratum]